MAKKVTMAILKVLRDAAVNLLLLVVAVPCVAQKFSIISVNEQKNDVSEIGRAHV